MATESEDISAVLREALGQDGVSIYEGTSIEHVEYQDPIFRLESAGKRWETEALLVATGRKPNTAALNLQAAAIELNEQGYINLSPQFETTLRSAYAIGEVAGQPAFTHVAWEDYRRLLDLLNGGGRRRDDRVLGYAVFTEPQVGRAGLSLKQAQAMGYRTATARMELENMARAMEWGHDLEFYRIVADQDTGHLLGAELVGYETAELVHVFLDLIEKGATLGELGRWQHIHPTYAENFPTLARMAET